MQPELQSNFPGVEVDEKIQEIGEVDILVGIPSFNNAATIKHVVGAIKARFRQILSR